MIRDVIAFSNVCVCFKTEKAMPELLLVFVDAAAIASCGDDKVWNSGRGYKGGNYCHIGHCVTSRGTCCQPLRQISWDPVAMPCELRHRTLEAKEVHEKNDWIGSGPALK